MVCALMHKRLAVAELELNEATGSIQGIGSVWMPGHLPVGTCTVSGKADRIALNEWWLNRSIPASRPGIREALEALGVAGTGLLALRGHGFSLSDHYWLRTPGSGVTWDQVSFFDNPFSADVGDVLFGRPRKEDGFDFRSPDNTTDGALKKRWKIINGRRCLVKGGSGPFQQQPFNEVIASGIMGRLGIPHAPYTLIWDDGLPCSVCEDFVSPCTELVSAWRIMRTAERDEGTSVYRHFVNCCQTLGAGDIVPALDRMIVLDYLVANEDRHLNNFGLLRNPVTLEWLGMAPIFDSGSSLGYNKTAERIGVGEDVACKPFERRHTEQLKLVSTFDWLDLDALSDIGPLIRETLSDGRVQEFVGGERVEAIVGSAEERARILQDFAISRQSLGAASGTEGDVEAAVDAVEDDAPPLTV